MSQPTEEQVQDLLEQLISIQNAAVDQHRKSEIEPAILRAYRTSNHWSILLQASYAVWRYERAREAVRAVHGPEAALAFPRQLLVDAAPPGLDSRVHSKCVELIEEIANVDQSPKAEDLILWLADNGAHNALADLVVLTTLVGRMLADTMADIDSLASLVANEGVEVMLNWIEEKGLS